MTVAEWNQFIGGSICRVMPDGTLLHPGLPVGWSIFVWVAVFLIAFWGLYTPVQTKPNGDIAKSVISVAAIPGIGKALRNFWIKPWIIIPAKILTAGLFLLVIWAGLAGSPVPGRNIATVLTWNIWWSGVIISVLFAGSAWCAICPWDTLANLLVKLRLWKRGVPGGTLARRVPKTLRNVWTALLLFVGLTWLELGFGITTSPRATAFLALAILVLAIFLLAVFERKALCRFACPVGRTIGFYAQLAPVELRAQDASICATCTTLECYHGSETVDPCPTHLVMGKLKQNTFCTSCGNCARSCPHKNVAWQLRSPAHEALEGARPHWDEAWFMLILLALTGFHGLTMMEFWEDWVRQLGRQIGDSGRLLASFSISMGIAITIPMLIYLGTVLLTRWTTGSKLSLRLIFARLSFVALPLAFAYHLAHNLSHLLRESVGAVGVFANPLGTGMLPLSVNERHLQMLDLAITPLTLSTIQALLIVFGFVFAVLVIRRRGVHLLPDKSKSTLPLVPVFGFAILMTVYHLWLLMQPMNMRM